jgi:hypothetical protein
MMQNGRINHLSSSLLSGSTPTFGVVPASSRILYIPDDVRLSDLQSKYFFFCCSARLDLKGVMVIRMCASTTRYYTCTLCHCASVVALASWRQGVVALIHRVLHDLEVSYVSFIINACAGA